VIKKLKKEKLHTGSSNCKQLLHIADAMLAPLRWPESNSIVCLSIKAKCGINKKGKKIVIVTRKSIAVVNVANTLSIGAVTTHTIANPNSATGSRAATCGANDALEAGQRESNAYVT
jgi:hypothetical protein